ncbi:DUF2461 domain-containing protein [uncultured Microbacterium sp.]|uniref:DUF2461 domain-containing protein n=1 Tax=uncultured Microbacterium sp. TaxID=191216 RepID=UPI0028D1A907|nr:DUF2461 domain-containing protein [uncultured Microbacterium sp.]
MSFDGLHPDAPAFFRELAVNNTKAWWTENNERYLAHVRGPFEQLAAQLEPEFGDVKIFRPYRDVRFSADKTPYKTHIGMVSSAPIAHYLQLSESGLMLGGGVYDVPPAALARFREIVDHPRLMQELGRVLEQMDAAHLAPMSDDALRTAPRGYPVDHPRIDLLRLKHLAVGGRDELADWMWTRDAFEIISDSWRSVSVWCAWVAENLGDLVIRPDRSRPR